MKGNKTILLAALMGLGFSLGLQGSIFHGLHKKHEKKKIKKAVKHHEKKKAVKRKIKHHGKKKHHGRRH